MLGTTTVDDAGRFAFEAQLSDGDGAYYVLAKATLNGVDSMMTAMPVTLDTKAPMPPSQPRWSLIPDHTVIVSWQPPRDPANPYEVITRYEVQRDGGVPKTVTDSVYIDRALGELAYHEYLITAIDLAGNKSVPARIDAGTFYKEYEIATTNIYGTPSSGAAFGGVLSGDGKKAVFVSNGTDLVDAVLPSPGADHLYIRDLHTDRTVLVGELSGYSGLRELSSSKDGNRVAYVSAGKAYVYNGTTADVDAIPIGSGTVQALDLSDDGTMMAIQSDNKVFLWKAADQLQSIDTGKAPALSGNGETLLYASDTGAFSYDVPTGMKTRIPLPLEMAGAEILEFSVSSDGDTAAFTAVLNAKTSVYLYNRTTNTVVEPIPVTMYAGVTAHHPQVSGNGQYLLMEYSHDKSSDFPGNATSGVLRYDITNGSFTPIGNQGLITHSATLDGTGQRVAFISGDAMSGKEAKILFTTCIGDCAPVPDPEPTPLPVPVSSVERSFSGSVNGQAVMGSEVHVIATAEKARALQGVVTYRSINGEVPLTHAFDLIETDAGVYKGSFTIPVGAVSIDSIRVARKDKPQDHKFAQGLPVKVAGQLKITVETDFFPLLDGTRLIATSSAQGYGNQVVMDGQDNYTLPVGSGDDYTLQAVSAIGAPLQTVSGIAVANGQETSVTIELKATATLEVQVTDEWGRALSKIGVRVTKGSERNVYTTNISGRIAVPGAHFDKDTLELEVLTEGTRYFTQPKQTISLVPGSNKTKFSLIENTEGTVQGEVLNAEGVAVPGLNVTFINSKRTVTRKTDEAGRYEIDLPPDTYRIQVTQNETPYYGISSLTNPYVTVWALETATKDIKVDSAGRRQVVFSLMTKKLGQEWERVNLTDIRTASPYRLTLQGAGSTFSSTVHYIKDNALFVFGMAGEGVTACAEGFNMGYSSDCTEATLNGAGDTYVELQLEEKARAVGNIVDYSAGGHLLTNPNYGLVLSHIGESGEKTNLGEVKPNFLGGISVSLGREGSYVLELVNYGFQSKFSVGTTSNRTEIARFTVGPGEIIDLGHLVVPSPNNVFGGKTGNGLEAVTTETNSGGSALFRGTYRYEGTELLHDVALKFQIPGGAELLPESVILNDLPVVAELSGSGTYQVKVAEMPSGSEGTLYYKVKVKNTASTDLDSFFSIRFPEGEGQEREETIASARVRLGQVDLVAPSKITARTVYVHGRGPVNGTVDVFVDGIIAKQFEVSASGFWSGELQLPEKEPSALWRGSVKYVVKAKTGTAEGVVESRSIVMTYDPTYPSVQSIRVYQYKNSTTIDTRNGLPRAYFSILPKSPVQFELDVAHPERVSNLTLTTGTELKPVYNEETGKFYAWVNPLLYPLDQRGIFASYDVLPIPYEPRHVTDEELTRARSELPEAYQGATAVIATDEDLQSLPEGASTSAIAETEDSFYTPYLKMNMTGNDGDDFFFRMYFKRLTNYEPRKISTGSIPYADYKIDISEATRTIRVSFVVPMTVYPSSDEAGIVTAQGSTEHLLNMLEFAMPESFGPLNKIWGAKDILFDGVSLSEFGDELLKFQDQVINEECHMPTVNYFMDQIDLIHSMAVKETQMKYIIGSINLAFSGVTMPAWLGFSIGTAATVAGDTVIENHQQQYKELKEEFEKVKKWRDDMAKAGVLDRCRSEEEIPDLPDTDLPDTDLPLIDMDWIYDPSGFAYEGMYSNRVEGAEATVMYKNEQNGDWIVWDAERFGQRNPLYTDSLGEYAWDVPEGLWKVVFTKEGYLTAQSEELRVLPPHFDVYVPMVSLASPTVGSVRGVSGGESMEFTFSKPMKVDSIRNDLVTIYDSLGKQVGDVVIEAVDPEPSSSGVPLAMKFRLVPSAPFPEGTYELRIQPEVQSYAGVMLDQAYVGMVRIHAKAPPADHVRLLAIAEGEQSLLATWETDEAANDIVQTKLYWKTVGSERYEEPVVLSPTTNAYAIHGLKEGTSYEIKLVSLSESGLESPGVTSTGTTVSKEAPVVDLEAPGEVGSATLEAIPRSISVQWEDPADSDLRYVAVSWKEKGSERDLGIAYNEPGEGHYVVTGLDNGVTYEVTLRTMDAFLNASSGLTVEGTVPDVLPPADVTSVKVETGRTEATLIWTDPTDSDLESVTVSWKEKDASTPAKSLNVSKGEQSVILTGLKTGKTYEFTIVAVDRFGNTSEGIMVEKKIVPVPSGVNLSNKK